MSWAAKLAALGAFLDDLGVDAVAGVNAQITGSWHIYEVFAHHIVDAHADPARTVTEAHVPAHRTVPDGATFHHVLSELGLGYSTATRTGVIVSMPIADHPDGRGAQFTFSTVHAGNADCTAIWSALDTRFAASRPATADLPEGT